ncbi:unnamed protein product [Peniophora sp. CBMAI 1063]|nr:unnamed protein product [Peniophora sp. CBMAI 1063]
MDEKQLTRADGKRHELDAEALSNSADDNGRGDEALKLVGRERVQMFSDEYNTNLRRKLVRVATFPDFATSDSGKDWWIPPLCAAVQFTQFLDKQSLNYASIMGFPVKGQQYNLVSMAFYLGFLVFEFPTVYISQKLRLAKYLGGSIVLWGAILMLQAIPSSFSALFALRFLLGATESCVAPILILIISMFYKKDEQATRISWFCFTNGLTLVFGGFIAYGISFYDGHAIVAYKSVFLLLGGLAITVGIAVLLWMPDSPVRAARLTPEERIAVLERIRDNQCGTENKVFKRAQVIEAVCDVRTWLVVLSTMMTGIPNGALGNFSNMIIKSFGYSTKQALILSTPSGAVAALTTLVCGYYSDRKVSHTQLPYSVDLSHSHTG